MTAIRRAPPLQLIKPNRWRVVRDKTQFGEIERTGRGALDTRWHAYPKSGGRFVYTKRADAIAKCFAAMPAKSEAA